jgi:acetoacetate decarboxylase
MMPAHFGGYDYVAEGTRYRDNVVISFTYKTDRKMLEAYIPEAFELVRPELSIALPSAAGSIGWRARTTIW